MRSIASLIRILVFAGFAYLFLNYVGTPEDEASVFTTQNWLWAIYAVLVFMYIAFEICIADDASTASKIEKANQLLAAQHNCRYTRFNENRGRTATRQYLATKAHYDHLLFLDADVLPLRENFLKSCVEHLDKAHVRRFFGARANSGMNRRRRNRKENNA